MNTRIEQFEHLDTEMLATVEGGWWRCPVGVVGSVGLGFLTGTSVGTVTLPVIGTVSGAALGTWSGIGVGVANFC